jgi:hypothetical protein
MKLRTKTALSGFALFCAAIMAIPVLVGAGSAKAADGRFIACPLNQANTGLVDRVTHPWWSTPQRGGLESVHVLNVGGQPALLCAYRAYNKTMPVLRRFPKNVKHCEPQGSGFRCW